MANNKPIRRRFWFEAILASLTGVLTGLTLIYPDWIEIVFGINPDRGSGAIEWALACSLAVVTVVSSRVALLEWRRTVTA